MQAQQSPNRSSAGAAVPGDPRSAGFLQTDWFCEGCGYNLHGQTVSRDERLGIMVCRCPECGRFHAAGHGTSAAQPVLRQLTSVLVVLIVGIELCAVGLAACGLGALAYAAADLMAPYVTVDPLTLRPVDWRRTVQSSTQPTYILKRVPLTMAAEADGRYADPAMPRAVFAATIFVASAALGWLVGVLIATFLWYHRGRWRLLWCVLPLAAGAVAAMAWVLDDYNNLVRSLVAKAIVPQSLVQAACLPLGLWTGRPVVRWLLRMLIPSRLRQHVAFLWWIDKKTAPGVPAIGPPIAS